MSTEPVPPYLQLYDELEPPLDAGVAYTIVAEQEVSGVDTEEYFQSPAKQPFEVRAPQFSLDPSALHAVFPPANASGRYDRSLAHVTLESPILPWERELFEGDAKTPWLALLLFRPGELQPDPATGATTTAMKVEELLKPDGSHVRPVLKETVPADVLASTCQVLTVPGDLLAAVLPSAAELRYLAHARRANQSGPTGESGAGWYSTIVGNRFPDAAGGVHEAHLVSLAGLQECLPDGTKLPDPAGASKPVQLAALASWRFTSTTDKGERFSEMNAEFVAEGAPATLLRVPTPENPSPGQAYAAERLREGYVPVEHRLETGEGSIAWYRGPLTPVVPQPLPVAADTPLTSADEALIYLEEEGIFDLGYAAAWSAGRGLALADGAFAPSLIALRRAARRLVQAVRTQRAAGRPAALGGKPRLARFEAMLGEGLGSHIAALGESTARPAEVGAAAPPLDPGEQPGPTGLDDLLAEPSLGELIVEHLGEQLAPIASWLEGLRLLKQVPFAHLVADERMLPAESLRFFYVDPGWIRALGDGALAIGLEGSFDASVDLLLREGLGAGPSPQAGLLLRSTLVRAWPGLVVEASKGGKPVALLRSDLLAPEVRICLFAEVPDTVALAEPSQGLHFGYEDTEAIELRQLTAPVGKGTKTSFPAGGGFPQFIRADGEGKGVLDVNRKSGSLVAALTKALGAEVGPAAFALQMIRGAERQEFGVS